MTNPRTYYNLMLKNYPQYEQLRQEMLKLFFRQAIHEKGFVDCYVNLNSYFSSLYDRNDYEYDESNSLASSVINFAAHIREFFASRFSVRTRFFFVFGNTRPDSAVQFIPEYDAHKAMDRATKMNIWSIICENLNTLNIVCPYLPEIYYIENQTVEPAVLIRSIIKEQSANRNAKHARLVFSKDLYDYQLVATIPNTHLIRVKKTMQGDMTYTVSFFDFYKKLSHNTLGLKNQIGAGISPELYSIYMTLSGCKSRGVSGLVNNPRANTLIGGTVASSLILNGYNPTFAVDHRSFMPFVDCIKTENDEELCSRLHKRFCGLDLIYQCNLFRLDPSYNALEKNVVDLFDAEGVRIMNNTYFKKYPLDLNVL